jgi:transglutaminase-like putative cysteine protease
VTSSLRLSLAGAAATLLAMLCLWPAFETNGWLAPSIWAVAATVGASALARRFAATRPMAPLVGLLALVVALTLAFARETALWGFLPTPAVLDTARALLTDAHELVTNNAAPVVADDGVSFLTAAGVGLVALVVDILAVSLRRAALAGLPLLALYSVPAAVLPEGVGWLPFAIGAAGYLLLLLTDARERVTRWGRPLEKIVGRFGGSAVSTSPLNAAGRRVGVAAVGIAVLLPVLAPGLDDGVLAGNGNGVGAGGGSGRSTVQVINPILNLGDDLRQDSEVDIFEYTTTDKTPGYLRLVSLDEFTGDQWQPRQLTVSRQQDVNEGFPRPTGLRSDVVSEDVTTEMRMVRFDDRWLPLPFPAQRVDIDGRWVYDVPTWNVFSARGKTGEATYTVTSLDVQPTREQLRDAGPPSSLDGDELARFLELPDGFPSDIADEARQVVGDADNAYDEALALQQWLRSGRFSYDESAPNGNGTNAIRDFLDQRRGYCVHFASTMTVLARTLGIPARVSVGFLEGRRGQQPDSYVVRASDAHAWPELYFEGVGWVPFEPTPPSRTGAAPDYATPEGAEIGANGQPTAAPSATPAPTGNTGGSTNTDRNPDGALGGSTPSDSGPTGLPADKGTPWPVYAAGAAVLVLAVVPGLARLAVRRRRWARADGAAGTAAAAWAELRDTAVDYGHDLPDSETPRQTASRLAAAATLDADTEPALRRVATAAERARYAPSVGDVGDLRADVRRVTAGFRASASRGRRLRARVLPASTAALVHAAGERVADALDWMDARSTTLKSRLLPRRAD